jgi:hypothetical protein
MARAPQTRQAPQPLESPAVRRSRYLAELLQQTRQPTQQIRSGGQLGAELLAQGLAQFGANRADEAVRTEQQERQRQMTEGANATLARLQGLPETSGPALGNALSPAPSPAPGVAAPNTLGNMTEPQQATAAPIAPIAGSALPPAAPSTTPAPAPNDAATALLGQPAPQEPLAALVPQASPQAAPNPLGPTPGEAAYIRRLLADPATVEEGIARLAAIEERMIAPPEYELRSINNVEFMIDPRTGQRRQVFDEGVPEVARRDVVTLGPNNPYGLPEGTGITISPDGTVTTVGTPPANYVRRNGRLVAEEGGAQDLGGNRLLTFEKIRDVRTEIRPILDQATQLQRNIAAVRAGLRAQNGAGDIAIVNGVQKMIDEGVVREGDVALQLQAQGIEGGLAGVVGYLTSTGRFSPEIRTQLGLVAEDLYASSNRVFRERVLGYRAMVENDIGQGRFEDVVPSSTLRAFGWLPPEADATPRRQTPAPARATPAPAAPREGEVRRWNGVSRTYNPNLGRSE